MDKQTGYELSRKWFDFCFENPEKIKPNHISMYFFAIEHCNRLGWKQKFGFPSTMVMEAIGIKSYNTYISTLRDLVDFGFIEMIEKSKNQWSSNIIALSNFNKAHDKALDKALVKHLTKQSESTYQSIDSIIKQLTINKEQLTINHIEKLKKLISGDSIKFNFKNSLLGLGIKKQIVDDWLLVRKTKKATNTETALNSVLNQIKLTGKTPNECIKIAAENNWSGFKKIWVDNLNAGENGEQKGYDKEEILKELEKITKK